MPVIVIWNPVCGDRTAKTFFESHVLPLLSSKGITPDFVVETTHEGHAGELVSGFVKSYLASSVSGSSQGDISVILGSGDGTLHEVINDLYLQPSFAGVKIRLALVPSGTANALYSSFFPPPAPDAALKDTEYKLQCVKALVDGKGEAAPISISATQLKNFIRNHGDGDGKTVLSAVVTSTALHAALLNDSEKLREKYPGLERFKIAAERNAKKWFKANVRLLPSPSQTSPEIYDPSLKSFVPAPESELVGPFAYFLSTLNVDRLEPAFLITPLSRSIPAPAGSTDVVVIRPTRSPNVKADTQEEREAFAKTTWEVMGGAYQGGTHVSARYPVGQSEGEGPLVVEYFRCGGWEWHPEEDDEDAHLLCTDGLISRIEKKGWAESRVETEPAGRPGFELYVA